MTRTPGFFSPDLRFSPVLHCAQLINTTIFTAYPQL
jgi:hypothetical protein